MHIIIFEVKVRTFEAIGMWDRKNKENSDSVISMVDKRDVLKRVGAKYGKSSAVRLQGHRGHVQREDRPRCRRSTVQAPQAP